MKIYHPDETIDGIMYGWALESAIRKSPTRQKRNQDYKDAIAKAHAFGKTKSKEYLIYVLKWHNPAYIVEILQSHDYSDIVSRFSYTFWKGFLIDT